jgi:hypothetical protein
MDFAGFTLVPTQMRRTVAQLEEQRIVGGILERDGLVERLPPSNQLRIELENAIPPGSPLWRAHDTWTQPYFPTIGTPPGFRRQENAALCPAGIVKVSVECIDRQTPGMGSHYGFIGFYLSVLVSIADHTIWDVRGEAAT